MAAIALAVPAPAVDPLASDSCSKAPTIGAPHGAVVCVVRTLGGRCLEVQGDPQELVVLDIKRQVAKAWQIQLGSQTLIINTDHLMDLETIESVLMRHPAPNPAAPVYIDLITREAPFESSRPRELLVLFERLRSDDGRIREAAACNLAKIACRDDVREMDFIMDRLGGVLKDGRVGVRRSGLSAMARCAPTGCQAAMDLATSCLHDLSEYVRLSAVQALGQLVRPEPGGQTVIQDERHGLVATLRKLMRSRRDEVRAAAAMAFEEVMPRGRGFEDGLSSLLEDKAEIVQLAALDAYKALRG